MNNTKAIVASAGMVMVAALGSGALLVWSTASTAAPTVASQPPGEVVIEYVDAPVDPVAEAIPASAVTQTPAEAPATPVPAMAEAAYDDEHGDVEPGDVAHDEDDEHDEHDGGDDDD